MSEAEMKTNEYQGDHPEVSNAVRKMYEGIPKCGKCGEKFLYTKHRQEVGICGKCERAAGMAEEKARKKEERAADKVKRDEEKARKKEEAEAKKKQAAEEKARKKEEAAATDTADAEAKAKDETETEAQAEVAEVAEVAPAESSPEPESAPEVAEDPKAKAKRMIEEAKKRAAAKKGK